MEQQEPATGFSNAQQPISDQEKRGSLFWGFKPKVTKWMKEQTDKGVTDPIVLGEPLWHSFVLYGEENSLTYRLSDEPEEEKSLRLAEWRRNPRHGVTQDALVTRHIYEDEVTGTDENANGVLFGNDWPFLGTSELAWLSDMSWALGLETDLAKGVFLDVPATQNKGRQLCFTAGVNCRLAMALLAIGHIWLENGKALLFETSGSAYAIPFAKLRDAKTYVHETLVNYAEDRPFAKITSYCEHRWGNKQMLGVHGWSPAYFSERNFQTDIIQNFGYDNREKSPFYFDGYETMCQTAAMNVKHGSLPNLQAETAQKYGYRMLRDFEQKFIDMLSVGVSWTGAEGMAPAEPYRIKTLLYMLYTPLKERYCSPTGKPMYNKICGANGPQAVPVLFGAQGIGKSTLVEKLALGWSGKVQTAGDSKSQEAVFSRSQNALVEIPELEKMSGRDINRIKRAITDYRVQINLKYQNGVSTFFLTALQIATTNSADFLADLTGSRRFLPIAVTKFDRDKTDEDSLLALYGNAQFFLNRQIDAMATTKGKRALLSLELEETDEDRAYKDENYSRENRQLVWVKKFLAEIFAKPKDHQDVYFGERDGYLCFATKRALEDGFRTWLDKQDDKTDGVFVSTLTDFLDGQSGTKPDTTANVGKSKKHMKKVLKDKLAYLFNSPLLTPSQQANQPKYKDDYAEHNRIKEGEESHQTLQAMVDAANKQKQEATADSTSDDLPF